MIIKRKTSLLLALLVVSLGSCARGKEEVSVVVISSLQRVLQNEINVSGGKSAEVFCARGETESFQIIVVNSASSELPKIDLASSNWKYVGDKPAEVPVLEMYREHYVEIKSPSPRSSWSEARRGMYPDALIPFVDPYTGKRITSAKYMAAGEDVKPKHSQGYWVDVSVGRDVKAGAYTNEIKVLSGGKEIAAIPVKVIVWDFELPQIHKLKTYFGKMRDVSTYHDLTQNSSKYKVIEKRYLLMLRDHGVSLRFQMLPTINRSTGKVSFTPEFVRELKDYTEQINPSITRIEMFFSDDPVKRANYLLSWETFLRQNQWVPEPIVYFDEPKNEKDYLKIIEYGKTLKAHVPSVKLFVTEQIRPEKGNYPSLEGVVNIFVPVWHRANLRDIKRRQEAGDEVWSYSHGDTKNFPSWHIDFPLLDCRIPAWFSWSLDLKGILYWQTTSWSKKSLKIDPWVDCKTLPQAKFSYGEGYLLYPGGVAGIDGPIASMRLKVFRDGVEDFDYFWILSGLAGRGECDRIVKNVASSFRIYSDDMSLYLKARELIAQKIIGLW